MGRALQNWDASLLSLKAWRELLAESLQNASRFAIHCWNDEEPWIQLALKYGQRKPVPGRRDAGLPGDAPLLGASRR